MWASGAAPAVRDATCLGLELRFLSQWWVFTGEMHVPSSQHYLGARQHILTPLFSSGAGELLTCNLKSWITWAACWRNRGDDCQLWRELWAAENCSAHFQLYMMDTSLSKSKNYNVTRVHESIWLSAWPGSFGFKATGFPEAVHSPSSAESEPLLNCDLGHTVLSPGQGSCWCIIVGCYVFLWLSEPTIGAL